MTISRIMPLLQSTNINLSSATNAIQKFNLDKWKIRGHIESTIFAKLDLKCRPNEMNNTLGRIMPGDTLEINGKIKHVIGFNGSVKKDSTETASGELFYGNRFVAEKYAINRARKGQESYLRVLLADTPPKDEHHSEAWFKGNWMPLSPAALQELNVEAVPISKYKLQSSKDIVGDISLHD